MGSLLDTTETSSSASTNQTNLATGRTVLGYRGRHTNMLMITTTVGMLYRIFSHTTNLGPAVALYGVLVVGSSSLEQRLVGTASSGNDTNLGTDGRWDGLFTTRRKTQTSCSLIFVVGDNNRKGTRASGKGTTVSTLGLDVANNGSLWNLVQWQDISNRQSGLLSTVDELSCVHAFCAQKELIVSLVSVSIQELHLGYRGATTRIMEDFLDNSTDVSLLLSIVKRTKLDRTLASTDMCLEDGGFTLSLGLR